MKFPQINQLDLHIEDQIAWLQLSRVEKRNAISMQMLEELAEVCQFIESKKNILLLIISGKGGVFSAGGDVHQWGELDAVDFAMNWVRKGHQVFDTLARLRQPVIGVLNGNTLGGGLELAACCDYRLAENNIRIGQPESSIGIVPGWSGTQRLVRRFGVQSVRRMAIFGEVFSAQQALELGVVDVLVDQGEGLTAARQLADRVLSRGSHATQLIKLLINAGEGEEHERVLDTLAGMSASTSDQLQEGLLAFKEKRSPDYTNKARK